MNKKRNGICFWRLRGQKINSNHTYSIASAYKWGNVMKLATKHLKSEKWDKIIVEQVKIIKTIIQN
ncbi:hypothetical protein DIE66_00520 [Mycoplasmopsis arginini]|nr:hypothetical protein DIE66_00520 [Mycoplasmopsis arginini]